MKIIAVISNVMLVYKKKLENYCIHAILYVNYHGTLYLLFVCLSYRKTKKKQMMLYDEKRIQSVKKYG